MSECPPPGLSPCSPDEAARLRKLRVLVLCGGPGAERAVSLDSGRNAADALAADGFDVERVDVRAAEDLDGLSGDVAVLMLHGEFGEDGVVQRLLDAKGLAYTGSSAETCALAIDKDATKRRLADAGLPVAPWAVVEPGDDPASAWEAAGGGPARPVMVKPNARGSSVGAGVVRDRAMLAEAVEKARRFDPRVMVESYVSGREFTTGLLGRAPLPLVELRPAATFYDYEAKYHSAETRYRCPAPVDGPTAAKWQAMSAAVADAVGARDISRVDFIVDADGPKILEINTAPGFTSHSLVPMAAKSAGLSFAELCVRLVAMAASRRRN